MFLPDRFIKGECPNCHAKDQYGDNCEVCSKVYSPTDLINPYSALSGANAGAEKLGALLLQAVRPALHGVPQGMDAQRRPAAARGAEQDQRMAGAGRRRQGGLGDWDISRDAPYFGIEIPDAPGKYFYVWLDAPVGYLASLKNYLRQDRAMRLRRQFMADPAVEQYHFIGKDIITFHTLFWPAMLHFSGRKMPNKIFVHGFLTVNNGEKMSKSRGTGLDPLKYLSLGMNPEWLRYYLAAKLNGRNEDIDFNPDDFMARVNSDLIGKYVNIASRAVKFVPGRQAGRPRVAGEPRRRGAACRRVRALYESARLRARRCARSWPAPTRSTLRFDSAAPWKLVKEGKAAEAAAVCSLLPARAFRVLTACLKPVLPALAAQAEAFLKCAPLDWANADRAAGRGARRSASTST